MSGRIIALIAVLQLGSVIGVCVHRRLGGQGIVGGATGGFVAAFLLFGGNSVRYAFPGGAGHDEDVALILVVYLFMTAGSTVVGLILGCVSWFLIPPSGTHLKGGR